MTWGIEKEEMRGWRKGGAESREEKDKDGRREEEAGETA